VAVERQRERSWDRRRRQHEEVGMLALATEPGALLDAEPVLLVHDREPEAAQLHAPLHERVRADDARDLPRGEPCTARRALAQLERRGEQRHRHAERLEELAKGHEVLLGENLGRRHHRGLVAGFDGCQDRERRMARPSWSNRKSSNASRWRAASSAASVSGKWQSLSACGSVTSLRRALTASGSASGTSRAKVSTMRHMSERSARCASPSVSEYTGTSRPVCSRSSSPLSMSS